MSSSVTDTDKGYAKAIKALKECGTSGVYVGVRAQAGPDLVIIAASNEFGTEDGHIPERSYLRSTVDQGKTEIADDLVAVVDDALKGTRSLDQGLARLGAKWAGRVQETIRSHPPPANAASTLARKGEGKGTLIDTGRLRQSIDYEVK